MRRRITLGWSVVMVGLASACATEPGVRNDRIAFGAMDNQADAAEEKVELAAFAAAANAAEADVYLPRAAPLNPGDDVQEAEGMVVAQGTGRRYRVFFGERHAGVKSKIRYENADPEVQVLAGFGYAWGWRPFITTDRVTTATDGTKVLVVIDPGAESTDPSDDIHQIFLMGGGAVEVGVRPELGVCGARQRTLIRPWTYVECSMTADENGNPCAVLSPRKRLAQAPQELQDFVESVVLSRRIRRVAE